MSKQNLITAASYIKQNVQVRNNSMNYSVSFVTELKSKNFVIIKQGTIYIVDISLRAPSKRSCFFLFCFLKNKRNHAVHRSTDS